MMETQNAISTVVRWHRMETTVSTNLDARVGAHGDVYVADYQTAGRGRLDHRWLAPRGVNLMFSAVFDCAGLPPEEVATFPLVVGLAAVQALQPFVETAADLRLKWPNDVLADGRKLCGILCERVDDRVIAGLGINVNQVEFPDEIAARATSVRALTTTVCDREAVLQDVVNALYAAHAHWREVGFAAVHAQFAAIDYLAGRVISVRQTDTDPVPVSGMCGGIQRDGTLLVGETSICAGEAHVVC